MISLNELAPAVFLFAKVIPVSTRIRLLVGRAFGSESSIRLIVFRGASQGRTTTYLAGLKWSLRDYD